MNRLTFQALTRDRLADARALLRAHRYCAAYYIAGYAVECALKSCIARQINRHDFPDKKVVNDSYTHDLSKLIGTADLKARLEVAYSGDKDLERNWEIVRDWSAEDRYNPNISRDDAHELYRAITERQVGVLTWLRNHW
jgi:HEPN domain-containing protein